MDNFSGSAWCPPIFFLCGALRSTLDEVFLSKTEKTSKKVKRLHQLKIECTLDLHKPPSIMASHHQDDITFLGSGIPFLIRHKQKPAKNPHRRPRRGNVGFPNGGDFCLVGSTFQKLRGKMA